MEIILLLIGIFGSGTLSFIAIMLYLGLYTSDGKNPL